jgi:hypothetical protein
MKLRFHAMAVLCLLATNPLGAKMFSLNNDRSWREPAETARFESLELNAANKSSDYQNGLLAKLRLWLTSEALSTFGPLTIGLILLCLPIGFSRAGFSERARRRPDEGSSLKRIGRSWDPRF